MVTPPMFALVVLVFSQGVTLARVVGGLLTFSLDSSAVSHGDGYALRAGIAYRSAPIGISSDRSRVTQGCQTECRFGVPHPASEWQNKILISSKRIQFRRLSTAGPHLTKSHYKRAPLWSRLWAA